MFLALARHCRDKKRQITIPSIWEAWHEVREGEKTNTSKERQQTIPGSKRNEDVESTVPSKYQVSPGVPAVLTLPTPPFPAVSSVLQ